MFAQRAGVQEVMQWTMAFESETLSGVASHINSFCERNLARIVTMSTSCVVTATFERHHALVTFEPEPIRQSDGANYY